MSPLPSINATSDASDLQDTMQNEAPLSSEAIGAVPDGGSCLSIQAQSLFRTAPLATSFVPFGDIPTKFLPQFPVLRGKSSQEPGPLITPTLIGTPNGMRDIQDIAKEAIRLTKETLFHQNHSRSADADNYHTLLNRSGGSKTVHQVIAPRLVEPPMLLPPKKYTKSGIHTNSHSKTSGFRLNKFVRRLHDMLAAENESGIVEWRRGLLVLNNTNVFAKQILPKYFNTRNFKTFRRQLNYYGFVHVRSYNNTGTSSSSSTTALWVNRELAASCAARANDGAEPIDNISSVLLLKRVEPCDSAKTAEGRRVRKELAMSTVEEDLGGHVLATSMIHLPQIRSTSEDHRSKLFANNNNDEISSGLLQHIVYQQHQHQPVKVVLEHHNYNTLTSSSRTMTSAPAELSRLSTVRSSRSDSSEGIAAAAPPKQPLSSSTSVANLLLLLSKV